MLAHFKVGARLLDRRVTTCVHVYDTEQEMNDAAKAWNGSSFDVGTSDAITQFYDAPRNPIAVVRLRADKLWEHVVSHELIHAAQAIYGQTVREGGRRLTMSHWAVDNEDFAHLHTQLYVGVERWMEKHRGFAGEAPAR